MQLALRRNSALDATSMQRLACDVIRARLVSDFCHGGIVINGELYHATATHGLTKANSWTPERWDLFDMGTERDVNALTLFDALKGASYDWVGLLLFVGLHVNDATRLYCFEWCYLAMTGEAPDGRVTPELLMGIILKDGKHGS